jgi:hypothetical protein
LGYSQVVFVHRSGKLFFDVESFSFDIFDISDFGRRKWYKLISIYIARSIIGICIASFNFDIFDNTDFGRMK